MLMSPNHFRIEHQFGQIGILQFSEQPFPHARLGPAIEPLKDRIPLTESPREVALVIHQSSIDG